MKTILSGVLSVFIALFVAPLANVSRAADTFIGFNDLWFYSDHGIDRGTEWRNATLEYYFEWPIGMAEMGFGDGDEFTEINSAPGGVPLNTAYFVTTFTVGSAANYANLTVRLRRDDGAIVYLNGVEVFRSNMPTSAVTYATSALRNIEGADESALAQRVVPANVLLNGDNLIAVEVHQAVGGNSDMSFDLTLIGHRVSENQPPSAFSSFVTLEKDKSTNLTLNATDPDNNPLSYTLLSSPSHGSLSGTPPNVTYTPNAGYVGPDLFSFRASDGQWDTEVADVSIEVREPSNHPPLANAQNVSTAEDNALVITLTATDADGDTLAYANTAAAHGTLTSGPGHTLLYQPALNYFGPDGFTFTVDDGNGGVASAAINITVTPVNDAPFPDAQSLSTDEDTALPILLTAGDVEGDTLSFSFAQPGHGVLTGSGSHLTYQPAANYNGPDSFIFSANDGNGGSASAIVHLNVAPVNDNPTADAQNVSVAEDTALPIVLTAGDVDGDALNYSYTQPSHGSVSGSGNTAIYQPAANYNGPDSFTFTVDDGHGGTASAIVHLNVAPVNDNPTADAQNVSVAEDTALPIVLTAGDVDGDALNYSYTQPSHGSVSGSGNTAIYQPAANYNGPDSFTFTVDDGHGGTATATINITVTPVNDAPVALAKEAPASDPTNFTRSLVLMATNGQSARVVLNGSGSSDVDGTALSYAWYQGANTTPLSTAANTTVALPAGNYTLTLVVSDGTATASDTVLLRVTTPCDAVQEIVADVQAANLKPNDRKELLKSLNSACSAFNKGDISGGVHNLELFQRSVNKKIAPKNPSLAQALNAEAQQIIDEVSGQ